ncbi:kelch-like protein 33 [Synchiropus splendidus]|uniref:kelch-like protein 33 n=1 Tax=Synchiropus splendidus TaxID=270530 RepID=UPI00237E8646|nr:kelch-like protein 33 [Synchiropus splendidus]
MEPGGSFLPSDWEEQWRREKERKNSTMKKGGEEIEKDKQELRRIVAYNNVKMGLTSGAEGRWAECGVGPDDELHTCRCRNHPEDLFLVLESFRESSLLTDLTLTLESGNSFNVHSLLLEAVSPVIAERLREARVQSPASSRHWTILLGSGVDHVGLQGVIEFAYTGRVPPNKEQILSAACALEVPRLLDSCSKNGHLKGGGTEKVHMEDTLKSIQELWANRTGCDVVLNVGGSSFYVHRVVLAASSDYFRGMFTSGMKESAQMSVDLPFLSPPELGALICCSYSGSLQLSWDSVFEIICMALQLQFQLAIKVCLDFMQRELSAASCLDVMSFCEAYGFSELLEEAHDYLERNFWEVSATAKFLDLPADKLLEIICSDGLCAPSELAVFRAVVSWVQANPQERFDKVNLLMKGVRFDLMTFREFREVRAINLRMECSGSKGLELYSSALKEFGLSPQNTQQFRVRHPRDVLVLVGGDQLNPDMGQRIPSREMWFAHSLCSGTGLVREMEWRRLGEIPDQPKFRHGLASLRGSLYVIGGCYFYTKNDMMSSCFSFDPELNSWRKLASMQEVRSNFTVVVHGERLYAIGGDREINTNIDSVEMYNPDSDSWSYVRPLDCALSGHAATVFSGEVYITGGFNCKYVCQASIFTYHPDTGSTHLPDMTHDRAQHCMEALRGRLYVAGGVCNQGTFYTNQLSCEMYNPGAKSWTVFSSLPVPHVGAASAVLEEMIYILGGYCQEDYSESGLVHRFNTSLQRWENMGRVPGAVSDLQACLLRLPQNLRQRLSV